MDGKQKYYFEWPNQILTLFLTACNHVNINLIIMTFVHCFHTEVDVINIISIHRLHHSIANMNTRQDFWG